MPWLGNELAEGPRSGLRQAEETSKARDDLSEAAQQHPRVITELLRGIEFDRIAEDDVPEIARSISDIAGVLLDADASMRRVIQRMVKQLPKQGEEAIGALSDLMESLTLTQITAVTSEVRRRVGLLEFCKEQVLDDRTYEIRGPKSIHRLLEQAMWIVDERYWLMHSNVTLRKIVAGEIAKEFKGDETKRPDFVCGSVDKRLIIIEVKRPSHTLQVEGLNQLERYVVIAQDHSDDTSSFEAYLVGKKSSDDLKKHLKVRGASFKVRTYADLISDTERRYQRYLEALN